MACRPLVKIEVLVIEPAFLGCSIASRLAKVL